MRKIKISIYPPHAGETQATSSALKVETDTNELLSSLSEPPEVSADKFKVAAWSPITYKGNKRAAEDAESVCALVYDLDDPTYDFDGLRKRLSVNGWSYVLHRTYKEGRKRLVLPLAEDCTPDAYPKLLQNVATKLELIFDQKATDLARLFFVPSCPPGADRTPGECGSGVLLSTMLPTRNLPEVKFDLASLKSEVNRLKDPERRGKIAEFLDGTLRLPSGERENTLHPLLCSLSQLRHAPPPTVVDELLRRVLAARDGAGELMDEWVEKHLSSYNRGAEYKGTLEIEKAKVEDFFKAKEPDTNWRSNLQTLVGRDGSVIGVKPNEFNVLLILENDPQLKGTIRFNELKKSIEVSGGPLKVQPQETLDLSLTVWFQASPYKCSPSQLLVGHCMEHVALKNRYDPVREFLEQLPPWDGIPRLSRLLLTYAQAQGSESWIEIITRKFFVSAIARAMQPGCQVDTALVLQGPQGVGKTSLARIMSAGFGVETHLNLQSKDAQMVAAGSWIVELGELASCRKTDIESARNFITHRNDVMRLPYGRSIVSFPRRCVYIGTTNASQPLNDREGNRRYWVVTVGKIDTKRLEKDRDQLLAEALVAYRAGEIWWLSDKEAIRARSEVSVYEAEDHVQEALLSYLQTIYDSKGKWPKTFTAREVAEKVLGILPGNIKTEDIKNLNSVMKNLGWVKSRRRCMGANSRCFEVPSQEEMLKEVEAEGE